MIKALAVLIKAMKIGIMIKGMTIAMTTTMQN